MKPLNKILSVSNQRETKLKNKGRSRKIWPKKRKREGSKKRRGPRMRRRSVLLNRNALIKNRQKLRMLG
jgi:hypothetical protein